MDHSRRIVFLIRDVSLGVRVVFKKQQGVRVTESGLSWFYKGGMFSVGSCDSRIFGEEEKWEGIIGVYDLEKVEHFHSFINEILLAQKEFLRRKVDREVAQAVSIFRLNGKRDDPFVLVRGALKRVLD